MDRQELRVIALQHATHDLRGNSSSQDVVARAAEYLGFLEGGVFQPSPVITDARKTKGAGKLPIHIGPRGDTDRHTTAIG